MIFRSSLAWIWSDTEAASLQLLGDCTAAGQDVTMYYDYTPFSHQADDTI